MNKTKNSKIVLVLSVFLIFLIIGSASAAEDTDEISNETILTSTQTGVDTVNNAVDNDDEVLTADTDVGSENTLMIDESSADDVLKSTNEVNVQSEDGFASAIDNLSVSVINITEDFTSTKQIQLKHGNLIINGNGHTIDGSVGMHRLLYVKETSTLTNITIKNLNFVNFFYNEGTSSNGGGVFRFDQVDNLVIDNCNFTNITTTSSDYNRTNMDYTISTNGQGGCIDFEAQSNNVTISNCNFINTYAGTSGGAINFHSNRGYMYERVVNCTFNNITCGLNGGAIEYYAKESSIENCKFNNTRALGANNNGGGAIVLYAGCNDVNITGCEFINTNARGSGGSIFVNSKDCVRTIVSDCSFENCSAKKGGGALFFNAAYCNICNCNFTDNNANEGGAIKFNAQNGYMGFCNFTNNTAIVDGGALCANAENSTVESCTFTNNTAPTGKDFYAHGTFTIRFIGLKFNTLFLTNQNAEYTITDGYGTNAERPAGWRNDTGWDSGSFLGEFLDTSSGKATIYPSHI